MAYTSAADIVIAAGGRRALADLADLDGDGHGDDAVIGRAQADADAWIDGYARRLYQVPFAPVPEAVRALAIAETIYRLKQFRRVTSEEDRALRLEREKTLQSLESGRWQPVDKDPYPAGAGGGTPMAALRGDMDPEVMSRANLKGYW